MSGEWYYLEGDRRVGPVAERELLQALASPLSPETRVWRPGLAAWVRAADVPELQDRIPPPLPSSVPTSQPMVPRVSQLTPPRSSNPFVLYGRCFGFWTGSLSRKEYTIVIVSALVAAFGGGIVVSMFFATSRATSAQVEAFTRDAISLLWFVCGVPPILGGTIKRLRDVRKTAWYMLVFLIPCGGLVMILFLMAERGTRDLALLAPEGPPV
jgi:uncharacterized membrane protein YhaH (DUF805 family)